VVSLLINKERISFPQSWAEMSAALFLRICNEWEPEKPLLLRDRIKLFAIMCNKSYKAIARSTDHLLEATLYDCTGFVMQGEFTFSRQDIPEAIRIDDCLVEVPKEIGKLTIGQNLQVKQLLETSPNDYRQILTMVVAVYLQPFYDSIVKDGETVPGEFDYQRAIEIEPLIAQLPITQVYPVGFFLLSRLANGGASWLSQCVLKILRRTRNVRL
jgi:hypothetical protein